MMIQGRIGSTLCNLGLVGKEVSLFDCLVLQGELVRIGEGRGTDEADK